MSDPVALAVDRATLKSAVRDALGLGPPDHDRSAMHRRRLTGSLLADAIRETLAALVDCGRFSDGEALNRGHCSDFLGDLRDVMRSLGVADPSTCFAEVDVADMVAGPDASPDVAAILRAWPGARPFEGLDWDGMADVARDMGWGLGLHSWAMLDGLHHDAEAPDGLGNPFDLPLFKREFAGWLSSRPGPSPP